MPRRILLIALCVAALCDAQVVGPLHTSVGRGKQDANNFTVDLMGTEDARPDTWGLSGAQSWTVVFHPPAGFRVRILRLRGDLAAAVKVLPGDTPVLDGQVAWELVGVQSTAAPGSTRCDPCADNTMLYHQMAVDAHPGRLSFDEDVSAGGLLEADNTLVVVVAVFLNTTGKPVHMEPTFSGVVYQYEKETTK